MQCTAYEVVWQYVMPLAAALILLESDLRKCALAAPYLLKLMAWCIANYWGRLSGRRLSGTDVQVLVGFGIASLGTVLGTFIAYATFKTHLGADGWKVSPCSFVVLSTLCLLVLPLLMNDKHMHAVLVPPGLRK